MAGLLGLLLWCAPPARGQAPPAPRGDQARAAAALAAGHLPEALERYEQAYRARPAPQLLRDLGQVAQAQGRTLEAADLWRRYLQEAGPELDPAARQELQRLVRDAASVPSDEVAVLGEDGALVLVDDRLVGVLPLSLPLLLSPGSHRVRVERDRRRVETQLKLLANRPVQVSFRLVPPVALVSPTGAAVLLPEWTGVPEDAQGRLARAAAQGATGERVLIIPAERVAAALEGTPGLSRCLDTVPCQEKLAAALEAQYVIRLRAQAEPLLPGSTPPAPPPRPTRPGAAPREVPVRLRFAVQVHDVAVGPAASGEEECPSCTVAQGGRALASLLGRALREAATRPRGTLDVASVPPGAGVALDGRALGVAPLRAGAFAGDHDVALTLSGYRPYQSKVTLADGQVVRLEAALLKVPAPPAPAPPGAAPPAQRAVASRPIEKRWWFWGAFGLAAAGIVVGGVLGGYDRQQPPKMFPNPRVLAF